MLQPVHTPESPLFKACVNERVQRQRNHADPDCCQARFHEVECWAQWDQQTLAFIRTWIWEQLKEQGFVNEMDGAHFGGGLYKTVFSDRWKDIYQFFLCNRESITESAKHQTTQAFSSKLSTEPKNTDLSFLTKTSFEHVASDWLHRLKLDPQKIGAYLNGTPAHKVNATKAIWTLYDSLIANYNFFAARGLQPCDLIDDFIKETEPNSSINDYVCAKNLKVIELSLVLRTLEKILSQTPYQDLFSNPRSQ